MRINRISILSLTIATFALLGLFAIAQTLFTAKLYRDAAARSKASITSQMISAATYNVLNNIKDQSAYFGSTFEQRSDIRNAMQQWKVDHQSERLSSILDGPFISGFAKANILTLKKLRLFDLRGELIAASNQGDKEMPPVMNTELAMSLLSRDGSERLQSLGGLWRTEASIYHSTFVPVGGLRIKAYLEVIIDPEHNLGQIGETIQLPATIVTTNTADFPPEPEDDLRKRVDFLLTTLDRNPAYFIFAYAPLEDFNRDIYTNTVYLSAMHILGAVTALTLGYLLLMRFLIMPIRRMSVEIRNAQKKGTEISVDSHGLQEFSRLADSFNLLMREVHIQKETLRQLSMVDSLTNLANRRAFDISMKQEWARALREEQELSLMLIDIDYFKLYNDSYGHQQGDECLRKVAAVIGEIAARSSDLAARYGGEEFIIILPATTTHGAVRLAEQLLTNIRGLGIPHTGSKVSEFVTLSIGIASCTPVQPMEQKCFVDTTDQALYQAKEEGRNRIVVSTDHTTSRGHPAGDS